MFENHFHKKIFEWFFELFCLHIKNDFSSGDDSKTIAERFDIRENMCVEEYGFSFGFELENEILYHLATKWIKSTHWLIEKDNFWIMENCLCETNSLKHTL